MSTQNSDAFSTYGSWSSLVQSSRRHAPYPLTSFAWSQLRSLVHGRLSTMYVLATYSFESQRTRTKGAPLSRTLCMFYAHKLYARCPY